MCSRPRQGSAVISLTLPAKVANPAHHLNASGPDSEPHPKANPDSQHASSPLPQVPEPVPAQPPRALGNPERGESPSPVCHGLAPARSPPLTPRQCPASEQSPGWAVAHGKGPARGGAKCPSRVSRPHGPGCRFVLWAGTGPRRRALKTAVGEGSTPAQGTRLGSTGRAGAGGGWRAVSRVSRVQAKHSGSGGAAGGASEGAAGACPPYTPLVRPSPQGQAWHSRKEAAPFSRFRRFQAAGQSTRGPPPTSPWAPWGPGWATATGPAHFPLPALPTRSPPRPGNQTCQCGPARASCGGQSAIPKRCLQNPCLQAQKPHLKKEKNKEGLPGCPVAVSAAT